MISENAVRRCLLTVGIQHGTEQYAKVITTWESLLERELGTIARTDDGWQVPMRQSMRAGELLEHAARKTT